MYVHMLNFTALFKEWNMQLGTCMIDYDTLTIEDMIAKGLRINVVRTYICLFQCAYTIYCSNYLIIYSYLHT